MASKNWTFEIQVCTFDVWANQQPENESSDHLITGPDTYIKWPISSPVLNCLWQPKSIFIVGGFICLEIELS
jgi:hypothetical protein